MRAIATVASRATNSSPLVASVSPTTTRRRVFAAATTAATAALAATALVSKSSSSSLRPAFFNKHRSNNTVSTMATSSSISTAAATILGTEQLSALDHHPRPTTVGPRSPPQPTALVFLMHGLGDTAAGWSDVAQMLSPALPHVKFVLPTAAVQPVSLNGGMPMPSWYDIHSLESIQGREDPKGLAKSLVYVEKLVRHEMEKNDVPASRVVVAGFSQGGAVALGMLRSDLKLAGVAALSSYLPLVTNGSPHADTAVSAANAGATPVFFAHGDADVVVQYAFGKASAEFLEKKGNPVEFKTYRGMGHSARDDELRDIAAFLKEKLPPL